MSATLPPAPSGPAHTEGPEPVPGTPGTAEQTGEAIDNAVEQTSEAVEEGAQKAEDGLKQLEEKAAE